MCVISLCKGHPTVVVFYFLNFFQSFFISVDGDRKGPNSPLLAAAWCCTTGRCPVPVLLPLRCAQWGAGTGSRREGKRANAPRARAGLCLLLQCLAHADTGPSCKTWPLIQNGGELALGRLGRSCLWVCSVLSALVHLSHLP